jgi:YfiH family protein
MLARSAPKLTRISRGDLSYWTDVAARESSGVIVAFSERGGGASASPLGSLDLAAHVGDEPAAVDANRSAWLEALGLAGVRDQLTMAEQVHGERISFVTDELAGAGAWACGGARPAVAATDSLVTARAGIPLALCFADCVPVVLVAPGPVVAVVHAGWRGALASLPGQTVSAMVRESGCDAVDVTAYVGAHIRACHYEVDATLMSQFVNAFGTVARAQSGGLDLDAVVTTSLESAGVASCNIARLGTCTAEATDRFFSYRAEGGVTGRHAALACIL